MTSRRTTLKGHALVAEGKPYERSDEDRWLRCYGRWGRAVCECGKASDIEETDAARKRWHREHKDRITRGGEDDA